MLLFILALVFGQMEDTNIVSQAGMDRNNICHLWNQMPTGDTELSFEVQYVRFQLGCSSPDGCVPTGHQPVVLWTPVSPLIRSRRECAQTRIVAGDRKLVCVLSSIPDALLDPAGVVVQIGLRDSSGKIVRISPYERYRRIFVEPRIERTTMHSESPNHATVKLFGPGLEVECLHWFADEYVGLKMFEPDTENADVWFYSGEYSEEPPPLAEHEIIVAFFYPTTGDLGITARMYDHSMQVAYTSSPFLVSFDTMVCGSIFVEYERVDRLNCYPVPTSEGLNIAEPLEGKFKPSLPGMYWPIETHTIIQDDNTAGGAVALPELQSDLCCVTCLGTCYPGYFQFGPCCVPAWVMLETTTSGQGLANVNPTNYACGPGLHLNFTAIAPIRWKRDLDTNERWRLDCVRCPPGLWSPAFNFLAECYPCPDGATCIDGLYHVGPKQYCTLAEGFSESVGSSPDDYENWRDLYPQLDPAAIPVPEAVACPWKKACPDDIHPCGECAEGYTSSRCGQCAEDYFQLGSECKECPGNPRLLAAIIVIIFCVLIGLLLLLAVRRPHKGSSLVAVVMLGVTHLQVLAFMQGYQLYWPPIMSFIFDFLNIFAFNLDLILIGPACFSSAANSPVAKMVMYVVILPLIPVSLFLLIGGFVRLCVCKKNFVERFTNVAVRFIFIFFSFGYIFVGTRSMEAFDCEDGVVAAYPSVDCSLNSSADKRDGPNERVTILLLGALGLIFWVILFPFGLFSKLILRRHRLEEERVSKRYGIFYEFYTPQNYLWELVVILRKLLLAAASTLIEAQSAQQISAVLVVLIICLASLGGRRPHENILLTKLTAVLESVQVVAVASGYLWLNPDNRKTVWGKILDVFVSSLIVLSIACLIAVIVIEVKRNLRQWGMLDFDLDEDEKAADDVRFPEGPESVGKGDVEMEDMEGTGVTAQADKDDVTTAETKDPPAPADSPAQPLAEPQPTTQPPADPPATLQTDPPATLQTDPPATLQTDPPATLQTDPPATPQPDPPATLQTDPPPTSQADPHTTPQTDPHTTPQTDPPATLQTDPPTPQTDPPTTPQTVPPPTPQTDARPTLQTVPPTTPQTVPPTTATPQTDPPTPQTNPHTTPQTDPPPTPQTDPHTTPQTDPPATPQTDPPATQPPAQAANDTSAAEPAPTPAPAPHP